MKQVNNVREQKSTVIQEGTNQFDNALVVMHNTLVRAQTKWSVEETKLFLMCISQVGKRDNENYITLKKTDVNKKLGIDSTNSAKLRPKIKSMMQKSMVIMETEKDFDYGFIFNRIKSDRKTISVEINKTYIPLVEHLNEKFTEIYIENVVGFKSKHAISLYLYLSSWFDKDYLIQKTIIKKSYLHKCFNLKDSDYWRNYGTDKAKFHWTDFENRVLKPAIEDINENKRCDILIREFKKIRKGKEILGYEIAWGPVKPSQNGRKWAIE